MKASPLRIGILGAARIAPKAVIEPARATGAAVVTRIAARDSARAEAFAREHGIEGVSDDYASLVAADDVDVVYNPLPMHLHAPWTIAALRAGKHVLCEKPFASNAEEAAEMVQVAADTGRILGEAFHHRYHPYFRRVLDLTQSGAIGEIQRVEGYFAVRIPEPDIRWDYLTSGGSTMDLGCYPIHWVRTVVGAEPNVVAAHAEVGRPFIDASLTGELEFENGVTAHVHSSMVCDDPDIRLEILGSTGSITAVNPLAPQHGNRLTVRTAETETSWSIEAGSTYDHMLIAFVDHVRHGAPYPTAGDDAIANMTVIDNLYRKAGLPLRGQTSVTPTGVDR